jgi:hypothetical protein
MIRENQNVWANNFQAWKLGDHGENWTMFIRNYQIKTFQTILDQKNRQIKLHPEKNVRSRHFSMHYYKKYRQSWTTFRRVVRSSHFIKIITKYRRKLLTERLSNQIWPCIKTISKVMNVLMIIPFFFAFTYWEAFLEPYWLGTVTCLLLLDDISLAEILSGSTSSSSISMLHASYLQV